MPRRSVKDQRKRELTEAAIACIARKGLQATTISDVSEEAGLSRGIVNFYFSTKEAMLEEALARLLDAMLEKAACATSQDAFLAAHFEPALCNQKRLNVWLEFLGASASRRALAKMFERYRQRWLKQFAAHGGGRREGEQLYALLGGLWMQCALSGVKQGRGAAAALFAQAASGVFSAAAEAKPRLAESAGQKKKPAKPSQAEQFDFGDLFARKA